MKKDKRRRERLNRMKSKNKIIVVEKNVRVCTRDKIPKTSPNKINVLWEIFCAFINFDNKKYIIAKLIANAIIKCR